MKQYKDLLTTILNEGTVKSDRTGTGTKSIFGYQMRFDLSQGFPLVTTKKTHFKSIVHELLWIIAGDTNIKYLNDNGVKIWDEWADEDGNLGSVYGHQLRSWTTSEPEKGPYTVGADGSLTFNLKTIDQLNNVVERIKTNPDCRRLIVSAWNVADLPKMALQPCHCFFQFYVNDGKLSLQLYQRSADTFLGVPFNIASYSLLLLMVAQVTGLQPGHFIHTFGDAHIYLNHMDQVNELLTREPLPLSKIELNPDIKSLFDFKFEDITLKDYTSHPAIKAPVAV